MRDATWAMISHKTTTNQSWLVTIAYGDSMIGRQQAAPLGCFERLKLLSYGQQKQKFARVPTSDGAVEVKPSYHFAVAAWICAWYMVSILLTLFNKWLFAGFGLKLPLLTTSLHFALKAMVRALFAFGAHDTAAAAAAALR